jgi:hypothetical protein
MHIAPVDVNRAGTVFTRIDVTAHNFHLVKMPFS